MSLVLSLLHQSFLLSCYSSHLFCVLPCFVRLDGESPKVTAWVGNLIQYALHGDVPGVNTEQLKTEAAVASHGKKSRVFTFCQLVEANLL